VRQVVVEQQIELRRLGEKLDEIQRLIRIRNAAQAELAELRRQRDIEQWFRELEPPNSTRQ
jgi:hypothetical protein